MIIGILAVQGAFIEHAKVLAKLNVQTFEIRQKRDLDKKMDGLILPGGESTTMVRLLKDLDMFNSIKESVETGLPVLGTCAGMILLAKGLTNSNQNSLETMDISVERNAYGRQLGSFFTHNLFNGLEIPMTFIRAPYVHSCGQGVETLSIVDDRIVAVRQKNQLATAFHPELTDSTYVHEYFLHMIIKK
ncbi:MAG: pyridoxal 5'-phosphate synthase glutaminase subunit PdxT [Firmicutes bacterium]|nr:pyridoxal 5'-phosphate synthase glutaminase subunit PdxT [Bacillota bacterium]